MQTTIRTPVGTFKFITQQYEVGLYVAIYKCDAEGNTVGIPSQSGSTLKEEKFHSNLRKKAQKNGDEILD